MKNKMTTTIDLDQLLADIKKSRDSGNLPERSVVKLTLEWELDIDEAGVESVPDGTTTHAADDTPVAQSDNADSTTKPDWRSTLAQFPNE